MKKIKEKLRSAAGETLAETLIALLVASFALMLLAGMISSTTNLVTSSREKMNSYYEANTALEEPAANEATLTITVGEGDSAHTLAPVPVSYAQNPTFGEKKTVTAFRYKMGE